MCPEIKATGVSLRPPHRAWPRALVSAVFGGSQGSRSNGPKKRRQLSWREPDKRLNQAASVGNGRPFFAANAGIRLVGARRWLRANWLAAATCSQRLVKAKRPDVATAVT
jgi:hypothetical protein